MNIELRTMNGKFEITNYNLHINVRTFQFAISIIRFCRTLPSSEEYRILIRQLIRSVTSIGANLEEASGAHTRAEFINCTNIARREARESHYWLKLIYEISHESTKSDMVDLLRESNEIVSILVSSIKKLQANNTKIIKN